MQNKKYDMNNVALVPIPWEVLDEIELDPEEDHVQFYVRRGRIIMKPTPADMDMVCLGHCYRCEGRFYCEKLKESLRL